MTDFFPPISSTNHTYTPPAGGKFLPAGASSSDDDCGWNAAVEGDFADARRAPLLCITDVGADSSS